MYTRRPRFLDEELDENKDVITSPSRPAVPAPQPTTPPLLETAAPGIPLSPTASAAPGPRLNKTDYEKCRDVSSPSLASYEKPPTNCGALQKDLLSGSSMSISTTTNDRSPQLEPVILLPIAVQQHQLQEQHTHNQHQLTQPLHQHVNLHSQQLQMQPLPQHYNSHQLASNRPSILNDTTISTGSRVTASAVPLKSQLMPSSSIMSSTDPDVQESAILRRQQLSRVAEWVQNNHLECVVSGSDVANVVGVSAALETGLPTSIGSGGRSKLSGLDHRAMLTTTTTNTSAATSIDSGYKTKAHRHNNNADPNGISSSSNGGLIGLGIGTEGDNITSDSNAMTSAGHLSSSLSDDHKLDTSVVVVVDDADDVQLPTAFAQSISNNNINNIISKRNSGDGCPNTTTKLAATDAGNSRTTQPVDFAQMEYNVKQFLLKQNEWSTTKATRHEQTGDQVTHRTETNL